MSFIPKVDPVHGELQKLGQDSPVSKLTESFFENVQRLSSVDEFDRKLKVCKSNKDRVDLFSIYFPATELHWSSFYPNGVCEYAKNEAASIKFREVGNTHFRNRDLVAALRGYNLAVCYAPENQQLGLAYANRSAVFLETNELELMKQCLEDIRLACLHGYPAELKPKLEQRRIKASRKIGQLSSISPVDEDASIPNSEAREIYKENVLFQIQNPNPLIPSGDVRIEISLHPIRGRELVVNQDTAPGTTLIVEKPFVRILKDPLRWDFRHCQYCLQVVSGGVPCNGCVFANYCTVDCKEKAFTEFHQYECPCWPYLRQNQTPRFVLLTLRLISKLGPKGVSRLFNNPQELTQSSTTYDSSSYSCIHQLISHEQAHGDIENFSNVMQSLILVRFLENLTPFFSKLDGYVNRESFRPWLTQLILHHLQSLPCNSLALEELKIDEGRGRNFRTDAESIRTAQFEQYASGVYGTVSLINHSCDPNVTRLTDSTSRGRLCIVTLKGLRAGDPLFTSYTKSFQDPLEERQQFLMDNYHFRCSCQACSENWLPLSHSTWVNQEPQFRCSFCWNQILKNGRCGSCKKKGNPKLLLGEHAKKVADFYKCYNLVIQNNPLEAIAGLRPVLEYFQQKVVEPFGKTFLAQDTLKRALDLIVYFPNSSVYKV